MFYALLFKSEIRAFLMKFSEEVPTDEDGNSENMDGPVEENLYENWDGRVPR